ncbi:MAG: major capsid protein [Roseovarius sp.]|nr:major capsid protein [Roseovarius sp.]
MATMNAFASSVFSTTSLSGVVNKIPFVPSLLGTLSAAGRPLFEARPVRTRDIFVDRNEGKLQLIPHSADGAPPAPRENDARSGVSLRTLRLAERSRLNAHELDGIRAFGSESELVAVQAEVARRTQNLMADIDLTHEHLRLGAIQGKVLDADGSTVLFDYFSEFGEAEPAAVPLDLDIAGTEVITVVRGVVRSMARSAQGSMVPGARIMALCGDAFWDALTTHPNVEKFFLNQLAAAQLREAQAFDSFTFGGIEFINYRGTDDNSTVAIADNEAAVFPVGARDMFSVAWSPLESTSMIGSAGQPFFLQTVPDRDRNFYVDIEVYSYPLFICQQPRVLRKLTLT